MPNIKKSGNMKNAGPPEKVLEALNTCPCCGCEWHVQRGDSYTPFLDRGVEKIMVNCPECGKTTNTTLA
jgi:transcription elongation factor Elf1